MDTPTQVTASECSSCFSGFRIFLSRKQVSISSSFVLQAASFRYKFERQFSGFGMSYNLKAAIDFMILCHIAASFLFWRFFKSKMITPLLLACNRVLGKGKRKALSFCEIPTTIYERKLKYFLSGSTILHEAVQT